MQKENKKKRYQAKLEMQKENKKKSSKANTMKSSSSKVLFEFSL